MTIIEQKIEELKNKYLEVASGIGFNVSDFEKDMHDLVQVVQMSKLENARISVHLAQSDIDDLNDGVAFDWTFPTQIDGEYVDLNLYKAEEGDTDDEIDTDII